MRRLRGRAICLTPIPVVAVALVASACAPASAQTLPGIGKQVRRTPATLPQMYEHAFRVEDREEAQAAAPGGQIMPASARDNSLRSRLQMTQDQFLAFREGALRFARIGRDTSARIRTLSMADRAAHPGRRALSEDARFKISALVARRLSAAEDEVASLHQSLSASAAQQLDEKVATLYSESLAKFNSAIGSRGGGGINGKSGFSSIRTAIQTVAGANSPGVIDPNPPSCVDTIDEDEAIDECGDEGGYFDTGDCECYDDGGGGGGGVGSSTPSVSFSPLTSVVQGGTATESTNSAGLPTFNVPITTP